MSKIYTRLGDGGETSLLSGERVSKSSLRVRAYGAMDEMQAAFGLARAALRHGRIARSVYGVQEILMMAMSELASTEGSQRICEEDVIEVEQAIDDFCLYLPKGFAFKVPGESSGSAALHMARAVTRRCERELRELNSQEPLNSHLLAWVNRVSDFCYVCARLEDEYDGDFGEFEPGQST